MFKITGTTIEITRGDIASIEFSIKDYTFKVGDYIHFRVYSKNGLNTDAFIDKLVTVNEATDKVEIDLSSEDTKIGDMANRGITYWYEIELNGEQTIIGYDEDGAKEFILYPEGVEQ